MCPEAREVTPGSWLSELTPHSQRREGEGWELEGLPLSILGLCRGVSGEL